MTNTNICDTFKKYYLIVNRNKDKAWLKPPLTVRRREVIIDEVYYGYRRLIGRTLDGTGRINRLYSDNM